MSIDFSGWPGLTETVEKCKTGSLRNFRFLRKFAISKRVYRRIVRAQAKKSARQARMRWLRSRKTVRQARMRCLSELGKDFLEAILYCNRSIYRAFSHLPSPPNQV